MFRMVKSFINSQNPKLAVLCISLPTACINRKKGEFRFRSQLINLSIIPPNMNVVGNFPIQEIIPVSGVVQHCSSMISMQVEEDVVLNLY